VVGAVVGLLGLVVGAALGAVVGAVVDLEVGAPAGAVVGLEVGAPVGAVVAAVLVPIKTKIILNTTLVKKNNKRLTNKLNVVQVNCACFVRRITLINEMVRA